MAISIGDTVRRYFPAPPRGGAHGTSVPPSMAGVQRYRSRSSLSGYEFAAGIGSDFSLHVWVREPLQAGRQLAFHTSMINPQPKKQMRFSRSWIGVLIISLSFTCLMLSIGTWGELSFGGMVLLSLSCAGAMLSATSLLLNCSPRLVFYSRHGNAPLFAVRYWGAHRKAIESLSEQLQWLERTAWRDTLRTFSRRLATELRELRKLKEQGVLPDADYARSKRRLLALHATRRMAVHALTGRAVKVSR